jgi:uncharacterized protein (UPF0216 family)
MAFPGDNRAIDKNVLVKTIQTLNQHLPSKRLALAELLKLEKPGIKGQDNTFFVMDKTELELISHLCQGSRGTA